MSHAFRLTEAPTPVSTDLCSNSLSRRTAALLNIAMPVVNGATAYALGMWSASSRNTKGEKEFRDLEKNGFVVQKKQQ